MSGGTARPTGHAPREARTHKWVAGPRENTDGMAQLPPPLLLLEGGACREHHQGLRGAPAGAGHGERAASPPGGTTGREAHGEVGAVVGPDRDGAHRLPACRADLQPGPGAHGRREATSYGETAPAGH